VRNDGTVEHKQKGPGNFALLQAQNTRQKQNTMECLHSGFDALVNYFQ
jgi:hypothetical protein